MSKQNTSLTRKMNFRFDEETAKNLEHMADIQEMSVSDVVRILVKEGLDGIPDLRKQVILSKYNIVQEGLSGNDKLVIIIQDSRAIVTYDDFDIELITPEFGDVYETISITLFKFNHMVSTLRLNQDTRVHINNQGILLITLA